MSAIKSRSRGRGVAFVSTLALLFGLVVPLVGPATANHPENSTLEVGPERFTREVNSSHTVRAQLWDGSTLEEATNESSLTVVIRHEVEAGPDITVTADAGTNPRAETASNTPTEPDMTCEIPTGAAFCDVTFTSTSTGTNIVRSWIDHDRSAATVEADSTEGRYSGGVSGPPATLDCREPAGFGSNQACVEGSPVAGTVAEPDITDVYAVTWSQAPQNICIDAEPNSDTNVVGSEHEIEARVTTTTQAFPGDTDGEFNCLGSPAEGINVRIDLTDDDPNIFVKRASGTDTGGPVAGGPNDATATTDANGSVTFVIECVASNCGGGGTNDPIDVSVPGATSVAGNPTSDALAKTWVIAGQPASFEASPAFDTNAVNTTHTITCRLLDAQDPAQGVQGEECDAQVVSGPNATTQFHPAPAPAGWIGECVTGADGQCTITYTSALTGTDEIEAWWDHDRSDTTAGSPLPTVMLEKGWVTAAQAPSQVAIDMEGCDGDLANPAAANWNATADPNEPDRPTVAAARHEVCATPFDAAGNVRRTPVTFTITSGPGHFTNATGTQNLGSTVTVDNPDTDCQPGNRYCVLLTSQESGTTTVEASIEQGATASGSKPWVALNPRNVSVTPEEDENEPGTNHEITATVVDKHGNPVPGATVSWSRSGAGFVVSQETTTNAAGEARIVIRSDAEGTTSVTVTITAPPAGGTNECTFAANTPAAGDPAGNCTATAEKDWEDVPPPPPVVQRGPCEGFERGSRQPNPDDPSGVGEIVVGTLGDDILDGTPGNDIICGLAGDDLIRGFQGADLLVGGSGDDDLRGGRGPDIVRGNTGADVLRGGPGRDSLFGGRGPDILIGGPGGDRLFGGPGRDRLFAGRRPGRNLLHGGRGFDRCRGRPNTIFHPSCNVQITT